MAKKISTLKQSDVLQSAPYDLADVVALQALANGIANEAQQKRALNWIIYKACGFHDLSYRPGRELDTAFKEGGKWVAHQINAVLTANHREMPDG